MNYESQTYGYPKHPQRPSSKIKWYLQILITLYPALHYLLPLTKPVNQCIQDQNHEDQPYSQSESFLIKLSNNGFKLLALFFGYRF